MRILVNLVILTWCLFWAAREFNLSFIGLCNAALALIYIALVIYEAIRNKVPHSSK